jgi:hypothetical protein
MKLTIQQPIMEVYNYMYCKEPKRVISTYLRPEMSISHIATTTHGSIGKHMTPLASIELDSSSIPMLASKSPVPACIRICGVK